ncbi:hypothetical protein [Acidocella sp.]|jgi:hypothetical protein|uniref:hypothetical protein n=1 Tax=Acidocella sp. TaxID=50710 RepID=UPI002F3EAA25
MQRSGSVGAFTQEPVPIANNTWDGDPPGSASIPDYAHNRLQCYGDVGADCSFEYKEIEVDAELLEAELLKMSVTLPASKGVLRPLRNGMPPQLEIEFGGVRTTLKMTKGVAALVLLISNPGQSIAWLDLDAETDYVLRTGKVRSISNASPEFRQLTPLPEYGNGTNDDLQLSFDDFSHTISNGASAPVFDANECNWIADMMRKRSASKGAFSKERQASLEEEERQVKKWIADLRIKSQRTTSPSHKQREALYHAMELALAKLPAACAPLAAHLGTLHNGDQKTLQNSDRRALSTDAYGIRYAPRGGDVAWETKGF